MIRAVLDTNVIFEGFTKRTGSCRLVIDAARSQLFQVSVSDAVVYEYRDVLERKLSVNKLQIANIQLAGLLRKAEFVAVHYRYRPISPDPDDDKIIECALNANAVVVTSNLKDFRSAQRIYNIEVLTPAQFAAYLLK